MLREQRQLCEQRATSVLGKSWKDIDKSELFRKALEYENGDKSIYNAYISAILVRYWNSIGKNVMVSSGAYDSTDAYNWLIDATLYTLDYRPWTKPNLKLYNDPNGPDKCMNSCLKSSRQGFYQWSNAKKRSLDYTAQNSLEQMMEISGDAAMPSFEPFDSFDVSLAIKELVKKEFDLKNYTQAFVIDGICNTPCIDETVENGVPYSQFNKKKLCKHLRHLDDSYCGIFASTYNIPRKDVIEAKDECIKLSSERIYTIIRNTLAKLAKNSMFKNV